MVGVTCVGTTLMTAGCGEWPTVNQAAIPGSLLVTIEPATVAGKAWWLLDTSADRNPVGVPVSVLPGTHTVSFPAVTGYYTPPAFSVTVSASATTTATGTYVPAIPGTGALKVTIEPAAAAASARWAIGGSTTIYTGSQTLTGLWPGTYLVGFDSVAGYTQPGVQTITVTEGATTAVTGTYTPATASAGALTVTITPAAAAASATWTVDGGGTTHTSGQTVSGLSVGSHTVSFSNVAGYSTPAAQTVTVSAGPATTVTAAYTPAPANTAALTVTIEPVTAASHATWTVGADSTRHRSGETVTGLLPGTQTVSFSSLDDFITPADQQVTLDGGRTTSVTGTYVPLGSVNTTVQRRRSR